MGKRSWTRRVGRGVLRLLSRRLSLVVIPHDEGTLSRFRIPWLVVVVLLGVWTWTSVWIVKASVTKEEFDRMESKARQYETRFAELSETVAFLKEAETELRGYLASPSEEALFEKVPDRPSEADMGDAAVDLDAIREEAFRRMEDVGDIRTYLREAKDRYRATPKGWPVEGGRVTSSYGYRKHPMNDKKMFHRALDVGKGWGADVVATADGIVTFSGKRPGSGRVVVLSHGYGYTTLYAHNKKNLVKVGDTVTRGETIALMGSSGSSTGPHVHYEVWREGRHQNPAGYLDER